MGTTKDGGYWIPAFAGMTGKRGCPVRDLRPGRLAGPGWPGMIVRFVARAAKKEPARKFRAGLPCETSRTPKALPIRWALARPPIQFGRLRVPSSFPLSSALLRVSLSHASGDEAPQPRRGRDEKLQTARGSFNIARGRRSSSGRHCCRNAKQALPAPASLPETWILYFIFSMLLEHEATWSAGRACARRGLDRRQGGTLWRKHFRPLLRFRNAPFSPPMACC